jgi:hypothetical protein
MGLLDALGLRCCCLRCGLPNAVSGWALAERCLLENLFGTLDRTGEQRQLPDRGRPLLNKSASACSTRRSWMLPQAGGNRHAGSRGTQVVVAEALALVRRSSCEDPSSLLNPSVLRPGLTHVFPLAWGCGGIQQHCCDLSAVLPWSGRSGSHCPTDLAQPWSGLLV